MEIRTWRSEIADLKTSPPGASLGALGEGNPGWVWRCDAAISRCKEKHAFFDVFHVQPKYQNDAIFVNTEGFRPCLSKPSYRAPKWALMVRLMQKERLKSPHKSLIIENQAFWVILAIFAQTAIWPFWPAISEPGWTRRGEKSQLGSCLNPRDGATHGGDVFRSTTAPI